MTMALGEYADGITPIACGLERAPDRAAAALAINDDVSIVDHRVADHRNLQQFLFRDETRVARQVGEHGKDIEEALMIGDQHVGLESAQVLEALDLNFDAASSDDQFCPQSRDLAREVVIAKASCDRGNYSEHDRIEHRYRGRGGAPY